MSSNMLKHIDVLLSYVIGVVHESWVMITTRLPEHRSEELRMVLAYLGLFIGCLIFGIAIQIALERGRYKESLKRRGGGRERNKEYGSGEDGDDDEEQELVTKTQIDSLCKQFCEEWEGTLVEHSPELKRRLFNTTKKDESMERAIRVFFNTKREKKYSNSTNELFNALTEGLKNEGNSRLSQRKRRVSLDPNARNEPTTPASESKLERKGKSTMVRPTSQRKPPLQKRSSAAPSSSANRRPPLSPSSQHTTMSPLAASTITPAQKGRRISVSSTTTSGRKRRSSPVPIAEVVKVGRKASLRSQSTDTADTLKMAKADAAKRLREQVEESVRTIESTKKRKKVHQ